MIPSQAFIIKFYFSSTEEISVNTVISKKGQIVIPKRLRDQWGLSSGSKVKIESTSAGIQITPVAARNAKAVIKGLGISGYKGNAIAIEEMNPLAVLEVPR